MEIICATGNSDKFSLASTTCAQYGIVLKQEDVAIDEVQGEDFRYIVEQKARAAFHTVNQPVVVTDDGWGIPALNGFPGAYMKSMNHWLTVEDFLRLFSSLKDKTVVLYQQIAFYDGEAVKIFENTVAGRLLDAPRGETGPPFSKLVTLDGDDNMTIAEKADSRLVPGKSNDNARVAADIWHEFAKWYEKRIA